MKNIAFLVFGAIIIFIGLAVWRGEPLILSWRANGIDKSDLASLQTRLADHLVIEKPEGAGPFPVIIQAHGCAGARLAHQRQWADIAVKAGYMAVIVDSHRARGWSRSEAVSLVCSGKKLIGQERMGDILAAIDYVAKRDDADTDNLILAGWSHGAWSIMDLMTLDLDKKIPPSLKAYDGITPKVKGAILFYPYCGLGALSRFKNWQQKPDILVLLAGADSVVDTTECVKMFDKLSGKQISVNRHIYPDTEHAFADPFIEEQWRHWHHPEHMRDAMSRYADFLSKNLTAKAR